MTFPVLSRKRPELLTGLPLATIASRLALFAADLSAAAGLGHAGSPFPKVQA
jgi:hypothetical protein